MDGKLLGIASIWFSFLLGGVLSAAQPLLIEASIDEVHPAGKTTLATPRVTVENGRMATIEIGDAARKLEFSITPSLQPEGKVLHRVTIRQNLGGATMQLAAPQVVSQLNQRVEVQVGEISLTLHTILAE
jgi:hypothetical protein